jgi:ferrous iron transport protein B
VTVVVADASRLERNLNLVLQIMEITDRVVVGLNLIDEAKRHGLKVDERRLARDLGVPVVPMVARFGQGFEDLLAAIHDVATNKVIPNPHRLQSEPADLKQAVDLLVEQIHGLYPDLPNARWLALRLLDGDDEIVRALRQGELDNLINVGGEEALHALEAAA